MSVSAREIILNSIRRAVGSEPDLREGEYAVIRRDYQSSGVLDQEGRTALLLDRLQEYGAGAHRCSQAEIADTVKRCLLERQRSSIVIPPGIAPIWLPAGFHFLPDESLACDLMDRSDGALTSCALAIASTGSLVLHQGQGRRALTLVPDYHLCVVAETQIVETVPEAIQILGSQGISSATIISGPSATSDIEMTRIKGVHGPRTLDVIVFGPHA
jgi:L-lactate dehydrogenase complex protein LldG